MGSLVARGRKHRDVIDITTTGVDPRNDGTVDKTSVVTANVKDGQPRSAIWIGFRLAGAPDDANRQTVLKLVVGDNVWINKNTAPDQAVTREFQNRIFPDTPGEHWAVYKVERKAIPRGLRSFETRLTLSRGVQSIADPDAQTVPVAVCYFRDDPTTLTRGDINIGHSVIPARPSGTSSPSRSPRRGVKR